VHNKQTMTSPQSIKHSMQSMRNYKNGNTAKKVKSVIQSGFNLKFGWTEAWQFSLHTLTKHF